MVRSYDGFKVGDPEVMNSFKDGSNSFSEMITGSSSCSHCAKPLIYDMSARIQAKQDYIDMIEGADVDEESEEWNKWMKSTIKR